MKLNYKEGMFLGKQELERQRALEACFGDSISRLIVESIEEDSGIREGVYNPLKMGYTLSKKTVNGVQGIAISSGSLEHSLSQIGRLIIGNRNGQKIGIVRDSGFTGKECFLPLADFLPGGASDGDCYVFRIKPATTNYEVSLISISSDGIGTFTFPELVMPLFREATGGRITVIKTSGNQVLRVASVDFINNKVQFEGSSFTVESNVQFMFLQTLSPYTTDIPQPLYTYTTCELSCDGHAYEDWAQGIADDGQTVPIGYAWYGSGLDNPTIFTPTAETLEAGVMVLDTVGAGQITTDKLVNGAVTSDKLAYQGVIGSKIAQNAVTRDKLAVNAWGFRSVIPDTGIRHETLYFEPGQIGFIYNENNPLNDRYLVPRIPSGFTAEMAILQPTRIILEPNVSLNPDAYTELREYFKTTGTGISLYFPNTMGGVQPGEFIYEVFDVFWMSLTKAVVTWSRVNIEW